MQFLTGSPAKYENVSTLQDYQKPLHRQQVLAAQAAIPQLQNYYSGLMSNNPADFQAMAAPEMRRFNEQIVPGLAEQFAGFGSGALSSSGFRNAAVGAGADLSERLGALRAQLRQAGAAGLQNMSQQGLQNVSQSVMTEQGTEGILPGLIGAGLTAVGGPVLGALGGAAGNWLSNKFGGSSPYGNKPSASPNIPNTNLPAFRAPSFSYNRR